MANILLVRQPDHMPVFARELIRAGHRIHHAPVTQTAAIAAPLPGIADVNGLIVTSTAGAQALPDMMAGLLRHLPCLTIGPATAKALQERGFQNVRDFAGEIDGLLSALKTHVGAGAVRWLYPCGTTLSHSPDTLMARSGADILPFPVYDARDSGPWSDDLCAALEQAQIDWTVFLSRRTARLFARNVQLSGLWRDGPPGVAACISQPVADVIAPLGFKESVIGKEKTTSSLVATMGLIYA